MEHSIGIIFAVLTVIGSESTDIGEGGCSASADGQTAHEKGKRARRGQPRKAERAAVGVKWLEGQGRVPETTCQGAYTDLHPSHWVCSIQQTPPPGTKWPPPLPLGCVHRLQENTSSVEILFRCCVVSCAHPVSCVPRHSFLGSSMSRIPTLIKRTESLTVEGFERLPTGDYLLPPWQT